MNIVITGAGGQLGTDLRRVLAADHQVHAFSSAQLDVADYGAMRRMAVLLRPDAIVHAAAYTRVDQAEREPELAFVVNALGSQHAAAAAELAGAKLVCYSTDYVFGGTKPEPYVETDSPLPVNVYGLTKLAGERLAAATAKRLFIVRTSWLYGPAGNGFVRKVVELARGGKPFRVVGDQYGSPTYTIDLARFTARLLHTDLYGTYHAANRGSCSRAEFARMIVRLHGLRDTLVTAVRTEQYPLPARRPANSALDDRAIRMSGLPRLRDWRSALADYARQYGPGAASPAAVAKA